MSSQNQLAENAIADKSIGWLDGLIEARNRRPNAVRHQRVVHLGVADQGTGCQLASRQRTSSPIWDASRTQFDGVAEQYPSARIAAAYDILWVTPLGDCDASILSNAGEIVWTDPDLSAMRWGRDSILTRLQRRMSVQSTLTLVFSIGNQGSLIEAMRRGFSEIRFADAIIVRWTKPDPRDLSAD